jgi:hypothetical protein
MRVAINTINKFVLKEDIDVYLVLFNESDYKLGQKLLDVIER